MPGRIGEAESFRSFDEPMEIVSLTGTLSSEGLHVHISLAGPDGACFGGHLVHGCIVDTTAELVIGCRRSSFADCWITPPDIVSSACSRGGPNATRQRPSPSASSR
jgi:riboflavin synthase alpha subunit